MIMFLSLILELLEKERRYLNALERKVRKTSAKSLDAEEISEELDVSLLFWLLWNNT